MQWNVRRELIACGIARILPYSHLQQILFNKKAVNDGSWHENKTKKKRFRKSINDAWEEAAEAVMVPHGAYAITRKTWQFKFSYFSFAAPGWCSQPSLSYHLSHGPVACHITIQKLKVWKRLWPFRIHFAVCLFQLFISGLYMVTEVRIRR